MSVLALVGVIVAGLIGVAVLGIVIYLVVRPGPSAPVIADRREPQPVREPAEAEAEPATGGEFSVTEIARGPHPRPRELDRESRRELLLLDERLHRAFFEQSEMSPEQWAEIADALLIVHDRLPVGILLERFEQVTDTSVSAPAKTEKSPREIAALLNEQLSPESRLKLIGTLSEPLEADVYVPRG